MGKDEKETEEKEKERGNMEYRIGRKDKIMHGLR